MLHACTGRHEGYVVSFNYFGDTISVDASLDANLKYNEGDVPSNKF